MNFIKYFCVLFSLFVFAQNDSSIKWGEVSDQEINLTDVSFEKDANAVVLYESGDLNVDYPKSTLSVYRRIKILTKDGVDEANQKLSYFAYGGYENIRKIKAQTINVENGKTNIYEVTKEDIFTLDEDPIKSKTFAFPNVKVGSIIELKYQYDTQELFFLKGWRFQNPIPTLKSEFTVDINLNLYYTVLYSGNQLSKKYATTNKKYTDGNISLTNVPSAKSINHVYNVKDNLEKIDFQLKKNGYTGDVPFKNWTRLVRGIQKDLKPKRSTKFIKDVSIKIPNGISEKETIKNVVDYISNNIGFNGFIDYFPSKTCKETVKEKSGNSADLNHLLHMLLISKGIDSKYVLMSTREHGKIILTFPFLKQLNKSINLITLNDGTNYLIDASEINENDFTFMPKENYNHFALMLNERKDQWIKVIQPVSSLISVQTFKLKSDSIEFVNHFQQSGFFIEKNEEYENKFKPSLALNFNQTSEQKNKSKRGSRIYKSVSHSAIEDEFFVVENPLSEYIEHFDFEAETRSYNIEFDFKQDIGVQVKVEVPKNYNYIIPKEFDRTVESINGNLYYHQSAKVEGNQLVVNYEFSISELLIKSNDYEKVKQFFKDVKNVIQEQVFIKQ